MKFSITNQKQINNTSATMNTFSKLISLTVESRRRLRTGEIPAKPVHPARYPQEIEFTQHHRILLEFD